MNVVIMVIMMKKINR